MTTITNNKIPCYISIPLLFCSSAAIAAGQSTSSPQFEDEYREVNNANYNYVGGRTRVGVGVDTEFDGTADISHIFSETKDTATSGDAWVGFDFSGKDKGVNAGGVRLNHHWVTRDVQGRPLRVNKIFGAYDRNVTSDDRATIGYGQEVDKGFWEAYVGKGLSGKRIVGTTPDGRTLSEKGFEYNVGGQIGTFLPGSNLRVRGGLDYAWDDERGVGEDRPHLYTVSAGVEKFFQGTPHSVSLDVAASRNGGGLGRSTTDTRGNLSYRYDFGGAGIYQSDQQVKRVRVEVPGRAYAAKTVRKTVKVPYKQAYKKAVKVRACQLVKSTVELGSDTFFKPNSARLLPSAKQRLDNVIAQIRRTGYKGNIRITGNTCDIGSLKHNQILSERRASAVKRYFSAHGFARSELVARGLGETQPKYPNTKGNRHKNRRVDIEYVTQDASCRDGFKTVYKTAYKTAYKTEHKDVVVRQAGVSKPSVTWKTEVIQAEPAWVRRGLHNTIRHNRYISTYRTTAGSTITTPPGTIRPVLTNDAAVTIENTPVTVDVLANDTGNGLTISSVSQPVNGAATIVNGAVVFTPVQGFTGTDSFTYTASDSNGAQAQATVTITVNADNGNGNGNGNGANVAPVAQDDNATTVTGQPVTIDALVNDTDANGDILTISGITQPQNGTAVISNGQIVYTPDAGYTGADSLTYTISDGNGHTVSATINLTVTGDTTTPTTPAGNVAPIAQDDAATSNGSAVTIDVLGNDSDADGDTLIISTITQPQNGTAAITNGQVVYTPNTGYTGNDSLSYTITDGNGHTTSAIVNLNITGGTTTPTPAGNVAPIAQDDAATSNGSAVTIDVLGNDSDADGDIMYIDNVTQPQNGSATIAAGQVVFTPNPGFTGSDSFNYSISDGNGHNATATVNIDVVTAGTGTATGSNMPPVAQDDQVAMVGESISINVLENDTDPDGDVLSIVYTDQPGNGHVSIINDQMLYTPHPGFSGLDSFRYTISDGKSHTSEAVVSITVTASNTVTNTNSANQPPVVNNDYMGMVPASQPLTIYPLNNDSDPEGDPLKIISVGSTPNGSAHLNADGTIRFTPKADYCGLIEFAYTVADAYGNTKTGTIQMQTEFL